MRGRPRHRRADPQPGGVTICSLVSLTFHSQSKALTRGLGVVYQAPLQMGPANPLWPAPTGYKACKVGIPYDDLKAWARHLSSGHFRFAVGKSCRGLRGCYRQTSRCDRRAAAPLAEELLFAEAAALHFASVANQSRSVIARDSGESASLLRLIGAEVKLAIRLHALQSRDSRIGFEASNQYYYTPHHLVEKVINCRWLESRLRPFSVPAGYKRPGDK